MAQAADVGIMIWFCQVKTISLIKRGSFLELTNYYPKYCVIGNLITCLPSNLPDALGAQRTLLVSANENEF